MSRFIASILCVIALLTLVSVPVVHAAERAICTDITTVVAEPNGEDGRPGQDEPGKSVQHQHGGCHGHHFAAVSGDTAMNERSLRAAALLFVHAAALHGSTVDPALRPPQA